MRVLPVHRDRFVNRQVDLDVLSEYYSRLQDFSAINRVHDFKNVAKVCNSYYLGLHFYFWKPSFVAY